MKIGVIGLGRWGTKVAREYIALKDEGAIDSIVLCDTNECRLKQFADEAIALNQLNGVLSKVDGIHICSPNSTHYEIAKKALESGVHVLVEKPMTTNHNEAYELVEIATAENLILQVGHIFRFANVIRKIKELYDNRYFGQVYYFNLTWTHLMPYIKGVDVLWDLLPHPLDILNFITKEWPTEFIGVGRAYRRETLNEAVSIQAVYGDGKFANIHLSWINPIRRRILEIVGSKRTALVECVKQEIKVYENNEKTLDVKANNTIREEALNFIKAIETGKNNFNSSIVGARNVEMIERAINSLK
ncbi:Gfo/Idh/MocA family protein [Archaeoglobus veneficus]|uniref:Oxidoreductase domain protein n=1 Tax=Archaeoglobus veneficus (strain DSM 11195 / SNP6) TaxID=693661 RepID=F2KQM5_ARCVS|nr:Gfo/Idh/MocA family oxidoreductase [Archaeoglobus veneficus]AEA46587.1 oxidoreductase domain protein [Archaeoglobus veneficus SNP6]